MLGFLLILLGIILRLLPHLPNFSPIAAIALFGGVYLKRHYALALPLVALVASDLILGFDSVGSRIAVYGAFLLIGLIGLQIRKKKNFATVTIGTLSGSVVFYLITNFVYFHAGNMYPHTLIGVVTSYYNALPFFRNTMLGDLFFTGVLFGLYELNPFQNSLLLQAILPAHFDSFARQRISRYAFLQEPPNHTRQKGFRKQREF